MAAFVLRLIHLHSAVAIAMAVGAAATIAAPFVGSMVAGIAVFALQGMALGLLDVSGNTLIVWATPPDRLNAWMNALHFAFGVGWVPLPFRCVSCSLAGPC